MDILWTLSNWKRTGPIEPSLHLARALADRGHRIRVACATRPAGSKTSEARNDTADVVAALHLPRAGTGARLHKHSAPWRDARDRRRLRRWIARERPDAVVCTLASDHRLAVGAARGGGAPVVRLWFDGGDKPMDGRTRRALRATSGVLAFGTRPADHLRRAGAAGGRIVATGAPLDLERLRADVTHGERSGDRFRFGIVARMQTHRRFEMLWEAVQRLRAIDGPPFEVVALGRGTHQRRVAHEPVSRLGLDDVVRFPGYLRGADYANALAAFDAQLFLVPGSDATCRALREGMTLGVPSVTTGRGLLPDIVVDGETGFVVPETAQALCRAMHTLRDDPGRARAMGAAARARADAHFDVRVVAHALETLLEAACTSNPSK